MGIGIGKASSAPTLLRCRCSPAFQFPEPVKSICQSCRTPVQLSAAFFVRTLFGPGGFLGN